MTISELVRRLKRKTRYGEPDVINDEITQDILYYINSRMFFVWSRYPWHWSLTPITINLTPGVEDYVLDQSIGDIVILVNGNIKLERKTLQEYYRLKNGVVGGSKSTDNKMYYIYIGNDSNDAIKIKILGVPDVPATIEGFGKTRITEYTVNDIVNNRTISFFPKEYINVVDDGVCADIYEAKGELENSIAKEKLFLNKINELILRYSMKEDPEVISTTSDYIKFQNKVRGKGIWVT